MKTKLLFYANKFKVILRQNLSLTITTMTLVSLFIFAFVVPLFSNYDPRRWGTAPSDLPPSLAHPFGTNSLGQDIFWLLAYALRNSLISSLIASFVGLVIGIVLGVVAGYSGGLIEKIILFFVDTVIMLPSLPIIIIISSMLGTLDMVVLGLIIAFLTWGMPVRNIRSMVLSLREREFTYTALFSGSNFMKILLYEYLPHLVPWIFASFLGRILLAIGMEVTLGIFGLLSMREVTLGTVIYWANRYQAIFRGLWWWIGLPIVFIVILLISLYVFSTEINELMNPRKVQENV
jgi:peptide/nickel transport system permease protein